MSDAFYNALCDHQHIEGYEEGYKDGYEAGKRDAAQRWHRVNDGLPEPHKDVLVSGMEAINNSRVYKVMVNDNGTWGPTDYAPSIRWDYWMPYEPPKEDET